MKLGILYPLCKAIKIQGLGVFGVELVAANTYRTYKLPKDFELTGDRYMVEISLHREIVGDFEPLSQLDHRGHKMDYLKVKGKFFPCIYILKRRKL